MRKTHRWWRWVGALIAAAAVTATAAPAASADHAPVITIDGVRPGMTRHQVRSILGPPKRIATRRRLGMVEREWRFHEHLVVGFDILRGRTRQVSRVRTRSPKDRFRKGIHVGVRERVLHRLGGLQCETVTHGWPLSPRGYVCNWLPWWASICGQHLSFYMRHRHRRVRYIELVGIANLSTRASAQPLLGC